MGRWNSIVSSPSISQAGSRALFLHTRVASPVPALGLTGSPDASRIVVDSFGVEAHRLGAIFTSIRIFQRLCILLKGIRHFRLLKKRMLEGIHEKEANNPGSNLSPWAVIWGPSPKMKLKLLQASNRLPHVHFDPFEHESGVPGPLGGLLLGLKLAG